MEPWHEPTATDLPPPLDAEQMVDVLYADALTFETLRSGEVEWWRRSNPVAIWRLHRD